MNARSIGAVFAGVIFIIVATTLVDVVLHLTGVFPPIGEMLDDRLALIATSYRVIISVAGARLTAKLAPGKPMKHALILGLVGTVLGLAGVAANAYKPMGPAWFPIALVVLAIPQCWLGGWIFELQSGKAAAR